MMFECEFVISYQIQASEKEQLIALREFVEHNIKSFSELLSIDCACIPGVVQFDEHDEVNSVYWPQDTYTLKLEVKQKQTYHNYALIFQGLYGIMHSLKFPYTIELRLT
jgi:hypothetical protein